MSTSLGYLTKNRPSIPQSISQSRVHQLEATHSRTCSHYSMMWVIAMGLSLITFGIGFGIGWALGDDDEHNSYQEHINCITVSQIDSAQAAWAGAVVAIGNAWMQEGCVGALREANGALDAAYSFERPLLFKPSLTVPPHTFRPTRTGALSYFVGACAPDVTGSDSGFALGYSVGDATNQSTWQGFTAVEFSDMTYHIGGEYCGAAVAQGRMTHHSRFTGLSYSVDKSFVYKKNPNDGGIPLITLHHSSIALA